MSPKRTGDVAVIVAIASGMVSARRPRGRADHYPRFRAQEKIGAHRRVRQRILAISLPTCHPGGLIPSRRCPLDELAIRVETPLQRTLVERALAFAKELERAADAAPDGLVLDRCESVATTT